MFGSIASQTTIIIAPFFGVQPRAWAFSSTPDPDLEFDFLLVSVWSDPLVLLVWLCSWTDITHDHAADTADRLCFEGYFCTILSGQNFTQLAFRAAAIAGTKQEALVTFCRIAGTWLGVTRCEDVIHLARVWPSAERKVSVTGEAVERQACTSGTSPFTCSWQTAACNSTVASYHC